MGARANVAGLSMGPGSEAKMMVLKKITQKAASFRQSDQSFSRHVRQRNLIICVEGLTHQWVIWIVQGWLRDQDRVNSLPGCQYDVWDDHGGYSWYYHVDRSFENATPGWGVVV